MVSTESLLKKFNMLACVESIKCAKIPPHNQATGCKSQGQTKGTTLWDWHVTDHSKDMHKWCSKTLEYGPRKNKQM